MVRLRPDGRHLLHRQPPTRIRTLILPLVLIVIWTLVSAWLLGPSPARGSDRPE